MGVVEMVNNDVLQKLQNRKCFTCVIGVLSVLVKKSIITNLVSLDLWYIYCKN